jgi:hypothetical protein
MIISEVVTLGIYAFSMIFLPEYFGSSWSLSVSAPWTETLTFLNSYRSIVCHLGAVRVESGGHGRGERVTAMDHQGYKESHRTRGNDEALGEKISASVAALLAFTLFLRSLCVAAAGLTDVSVTYWIGVRTLGKLDGIALSSLH